MPPDFPLTTGALRYPLRGWSDNRSVTAPGAVAAEEPCASSPGFVVSVVRTHDGMGDFVEDGIPYFGLGVEKSESLAQCDRFAPVDTGAKSPYRSVEPEMPLRQSVVTH